MRSSLSLSNICDYSAATLLDHVHEIVSQSAQTQMGGVTTQAVVAGMHYNVFLAGNVYSWIG